MQKTMIAVLTFTLVGTAQAGERLQGQALKDFWTGNTIVGKHRKLGPIKTYHAADGSVHSVSSAGKERKGRWWIDAASNRKCIEWNNDGKHRCHYTESNGDGTYTLVHGRKGSRIVEISSVLEGNQL